MELVKRTDRMREIMRDVWRRGDKVGFVPTMGALHEGHQTLLRRAREMSDRVVLSIFVNPLQFGPSEDFERYPRDLHHDTEVAKKEGVDYVFLPAERDMYPDGFATRVSVPSLEDKLCGRTRPGHFAGVCTVMTKLLSLIRPHFAFMGEKDAQQLVIVRRMVRDLNLDVEMVGCPTVREADGLAMSSRNALLLPEERGAATILIRALLEAKAKFQAGERRSAVLCETLRERVAEESSVRLEYAEVVDRVTLEAPDEIVADVLCAIAATVGTTRLIDNVSLIVPIGEE